jgi:long-chain acyl-CoA synthetase
VSDVLSIHDATAQLTAAGQPFELTEVEIHGIPTRVWKNAPPTLRAILEMSRGHGDKDFIVYEGERYTFARNYAISATVSARLLAAGVQKGDRVAIAARNLPEWIFAFWGTVSIGAIAVPLNAWWTGDELAYGLSDSGARIAFVDEDRLARIVPHLDEFPTLERVVVMSEHRDQPLSLETHPSVVIQPFDIFLSDVADDATVPAVDLESDEDVTMFYTSGTTGKPKGAVGSHRNAVSNLMNLFFVGQRTALRFGGGNVDADGRSIQNSFLLSVPLFHATGTLAVLIVNTAAGGKLVMVHHFDAGEALSLIQEEKITTFGGVPTIAMQVLDHPDFEKFDTSSVRSVSYGGAPSPPELVRRIRAHFPGGQPSNGYGLTETSAAVANNSGPDYVAKPDSCGPAHPINDVAIVPEDYEGAEPDAGLPTGPDVVGELWIKGPNVVRGYWNKPDETSKSITKGWLHTGDVARIDEDGFIFIVDRAKDMIIRGGENVYSVEVEAAIFEHPDVADVAVIGVPHPVLGEEVGAVVVLRPGSTIRPEDLSAHVGARIAKYAVPTKLFFRSEPLPRNPAGKVLKRQLRDEVIAR